jgi:hypothetical protein
LPLGAGPTPKALIARRRFSYRGQQRAVVGVLASAVCFEPRVTADFICDPRFEQDSPIALSVAQSGWIGMVGKIEAV